MGFDLHGVIGGVCKGKKTVFFCDVCKKTVESVESAEPKANFTVGIKKSIVGEGIPVSFLVCADCVASKTTGVLLKELIVSAQVQADSLEVAELTIKSINQSGDILGVAVSQIEAIG